MFKESAFQAWNIKKELTQGCPNENPVSLGILSSHIGPPHRGRIDGTVRPGRGGPGGPVSEGWGCKTKGVQAMQQKRHQKQNKPKNEVRSWRGLGSLVDGDEEL